MRATDVISGLQSRGVTLQPEDGNLRIIGASRITDEEKATLKAHKAAILRALRHQDATDAKTPVAPSYAVTEPSAPCRHCKRWCGTKSGTGWCVVAMPAVQRTATESCEQFQAQEVQP